jgi:serine phosphatase RsbU (regulator of sigma subunit)/anti-sigma regulatory factor (Ser/Thr protein kinase)
VTASSTTRWHAAPCGLLVLRLDGTVLEANDLLVQWIDRPAPEVLGQLTLSALLSVGGRIYWETHLAPLLHVEGRLDEVAVELKTPGGRLPVLLTAVLSREEGVVHVALSGARERLTYEREVLAARTRAERSTSQLHALQVTTAALSRAVGVAAVGGALLDASVGPLNAASATLWLTDDAGTLTPHGSRGEAVAPPPLSLLLQSRTAGHHDGRVVVALHGQAALRGALSLQERDDPGGDPLDLEVLTAVGQQAGLALDRAELYEQSANVARELQHSLLAGEPPVDERFSVATAYRPGIELLEVGGDWYDVFLARPGVLAVVVGDVVGRGLRAASAMGQLRSAVRAIAGAGTGPAALLTRLDHFVEQVEAAGMATIAYAELDLASGRLRYACAGHPPPLLVPDHVAPQLLWGGRSTPLGGFVRPLERPEAEVALSPGDRLLLCTDGLFERRDRDLDEGLELLAIAAADLQPLSLPEAVSSLTSRLLQDETTRDDVCVLLLAWAGDRFERWLSADLMTLSAVRRELADWLSAHGIDDGVCADLVLAASEAVANAGEHGAGRLSSEQVSLRVRIEPSSQGADDVVLSVRDSGQWRTGARSHERGRGLLIMEALVDDVRVEKGAGTTVVLRKQISRRGS